MTRWGTEDFQGSETTLYGAIMMGTSHYTFVETYRMPNAKSEPNVKSG